MTDGTELRQMAELGIAVVSLEYDQSNVVAFNAQFTSVLNYLSQQKWANTNAVAWVGFSMGANRIWEFAAVHPTRQPQLLVQLSGAGMEQPCTDSQSLTNLHCPVLLIHGEQDEIFPIDDTRRLASALQTNGLPTELKIIPGASHDMGMAHEVVFRCIGEYCLTHLTASGIAPAIVWQQYHSIAQWEAEAPPFWLFCLPAASWVVGGFAWRRYRWSDPPEKVPLTRWEIALRWLAAILAVWALIETGIHLLTPHFSVTDRTLAIAQRFLVPPNEYNDFEYLAAQPIWQGQKLEILLTHVELAHYNRELINWQLDDKIYRDYVLSPVLEPAPGIRHPASSFNWRRLLWEEFYPRIRHETSPADAAEIAVRHLRERVTIAALPNPPREVPDIWLKQITDQTGFEIIYVATLRSVGIPARLNPQQQAEFFDGTVWRPAPSPLASF
jgi:hypothetical protein